MVTLKVEIWSDFVCPFCYIGKRRFEAALDKFAGKDGVEVVYRSFELDPAAPHEVPYDVHEMLARKYGMSREQAKMMNARVTEQAREVGLDYRMDEIKLTNTFDAHRLAHFAATRGRQREMTERLMKAYFTESKHIGDKETLAQLAEEVGLDRNEAKRLLESGAYSADVRADQREGAALGIRGVPFYVIDRKYGVSGAQPEEVFLRALEKAWSEKDAPVS